jgi:hypothetical protein
MARRRWARNRHAGRAFNSGRKKVLGGETTSRRGDGQSCGILRINPSHDLPQGLGEARHGVSTTPANRLFFKPEKGKTIL